MDHTSTKAFKNLKLQRNPVLNSFKCVIIYNEHGTCHGILYLLSLLYNDNIKFYLMYFFFTAGVRNLKIYYIGMYIYTATVYRKQLLYWQIFLYSSISHFYITYTIKLFKNIYSTRLFRNINNKKVQLFIHMKYTRTYIL